ncbi:MAG: hypothetical protein ACR2RB_02000 [Gammaproteobacteria bacterium]
MSDTLTSKPGGEAVLPPNETDMPQHATMESGNRSFNPADSLTGTWPGFDPGAQSEDNFDNTAWGSVRIPL